MSEKVPSSISWKRYNERVSEGGPRALCTRGLDYVTTRGAALDLGAGSLVDTHFLLNAGFDHVTALDADPDSEERAAAITDEHFTFVSARFEDFAPESDSFNYITAQNCLSFIPPAHFTAVFAQLVHSLRPHGILAANFFGNKDGWANTHPERTFFTEAQLRTALEDLTIIDITELEHDRGTALGEPKHWHLFNVIAEKPA